MILSRLVIMMSNPRTAESLPNCEDCRQKSGRLALGGPTVLNR
jgi:hypothetical protein